MTTLARLNILIGADASELEQKLAGTQQKLSNIGANLTAFGANLTKNVTLPLAAVGLASFKMAFDAEEAANKFDVVMGGSAERVRARLQELTETIPLTRYEMEAMAGGIQDMLVPMGLARDRAADMSAEMVELAGDLGSFNNVGTTEVLEAMKSALAGSSEPMRRFGVDTRITRLEQLALEEGIVGVGEELDNTTTALAVMAAIQADSTDAMGDAARTVDSTSNSVKFFWRDLKQLSLTIGEELIPILTPLIQKATDLVGWFQGLSPEVKQVAVVLGVLAAAAGPVLIVLGTMASGIAGVTTAITVLTRVLPLLYAALGPAGWLAIGLTAAAAALVLFRRRTVEAKDAVTDLGEEWDWLRRIAPAATHVVAEAAEQDLGRTSVGAVEDLGDAIVDLGLTTDEVVGIEMPKRFRDWQNGLRVIVPEIVTETTQTWRKGMEDVVAKTEAGIGDVFDLFGDLGSLLPGNVGQIVTDIEGKWRTIQGVLENPLIGEGGALGKIWGAIKAWADDILGLFEGLIGKAAEFGKSLAGIGGPSGGGLPDLGGGGGGGRGWGRRGQPVHWCHSNRRKHRR